MGGVICLQTRNGVHAEIARGSGLESAAASFYMTTFAALHSASFEWMNKVKAFLPVFFFFPRVCKTKMGGGGGATVCHGQITGSFLGCCGLDPSAST